MLRVCTVESLLATVSDFCYRSARSVGIGLRSEGLHNISSLYSFVKTVGGCNMEGMCQILDRWKSFACARSNITNDLNFSD